MRLKAFIVFLFSILIAHSVFAVAIKIHGSVTAGGNEKLANAKLNLFWINTAAKEGENKLNVLLTTTSNANGAFQFVLTEVKENGFYLVSANYQGNQAMSPSLMLFENQSEQKVNIDIPKSAPLKELQISKRIQVVEPDDGGVFVTDVLLVNNVNKRALDHMGIPLKISVPRAAEKFENLSRDLNITYLEDTSQASIPLRMEPGQRQIVFRYFLSSLMPATSYHFTLSKNLRWFEVMVPKDLYKVELNGSKKSPKETALQKMPFHFWGMPVNAKMASMTVKISGIASNLYQYLMGGLLAVLLLAGLGVFLKRNKSS